MTSERAERIVVEVAAGKLESKSDTPEEAEFRKKIAADIDDIKARGFIPDIPWDP